MIGTDAFLVWSGDYSDKRVVGVFTSEDLADAWMSKHREILSHPRVEWVRLDRPHFWGDGESLYRVDMNERGEVEEIKKATHWDMDMDDERGEFPKDFPGWRYFVVSTSAEGAVKVASERFHMHKADST